MPNSNQSTKKEEKGRLCRNLPSWVKLTIIILVLFLILVLLYMCWEPSSNKRATKIERTLGYKFAGFEGYLKTTTTLSELKLYDSKTLTPNTDVGTDNAEEHPTMRKAVDNRNLALNKPVAEILLNVKRMSGDSENQKRNEFLFQFDQRRLTSQVVYYEQHSVNAGTYPSNLTDGDHSTSAYPADFVFDYVVDLKGKYKLSTVMLDWGSFGTSLKEDNYITGWELYGQESFSAKDFPSMNDWVLIKKGGIPGTKMTRVSDKFLQKPVRRLRIRAQSEATDNRRANWVGIYEIEAYGTLMK